MNLTSSGNLNKVENHGCIVCGRIHTMLIVYTPSGKLIGSTVTTGDGHPVPDETRPMVACNSHTAKEIENALAKHYPGKEQEEDRQEK
jgi:phage/plasmid primase-like uncharacterized protein